MARARLIASIGAVLSAYAATAAVITNHLVLVGPMAASFVACLFAASLLEERFDESVEEGADVVHEKNFVARSFAMLRK